MKKFVTLFCVLIIPLTLASDTQHRFKVYVDVSGDENANQAINIVESHLKRELRLLGDVDVVERDDDWEFIYKVFMLTGEFTDGRQTGDFSIATYYARRLGEYHYKTLDSYQIMQATWGGVLGAATYTRDSLPEFCISKINRFDKNMLGPNRKRLKGISY